MYICKNKFNKTKGLTAIPPTTKVVGFLAVSIMNKIANIVTSVKKHNYSNMFNVIDTTNECIEGIPTIVVGWKLMKSLYPEANILDKEYNGIRWTFSKTERRCDYEEDIVKFYQDSILKIMSDIKYIYIDLSKYSLTSIKKMIGFLKGNSKKIVFLTRESQFMFVYSKDYNTVFGISLSFCEYLGIPKKKVIKLLRNTEFIHDTSFIDVDIRKIIGTNTHYILPLYCYFH